MRGSVLSGMSDVSQTQGMSLIEFVQHKSGNKTFEDICNQLEGKIDFENWNIMKVIGKGAFAKVYLVKRDKTINQVPAELRNTGHFRGSVQPNPNDVRQFQSVCMGNNGKTSGNNGGDMQLGMPDFVTTNNSNVNNTNDHSPVRKSCMAPTAGTEMMKESAKLEP